jgi:recombinational DNA repair protein (RecF pathway)
MAEKTAEQCEMIIGYLVPHRCENPSLGTCAKCGRGYCDEHTNQTREGRVCLACQQGLDMPVALPIAATTFTTTDLDTFNRASMWDDEDRTDMFSDLS